MSHRHQQQQHLFFWVLCCLFCCLSGQSSRSAVPAFFHFSVSSFLISALLSPVRSLHFCSHPRASQTGKSRQASQPANTKALTFIKGKRRQTVALPCIRENSLFLSYTSCIITLCAHTAPTYSDRSEREIIEQK